MRSLLEIDPNNPRNTSMYMGVLQLELLNESECEGYPHLDMEETCTNENLLDVIFNDEIKSCG